MYFSWFLLAGLVLILMAFASRWVSRMPLSFAVIYLAAGLLIGPGGLDLLAVDLVRHARSVEVLAEVAVLISLFAVGLRLHLPLTWNAWRTPIKLASLTMVLTIAGIALVVAAVFFLRYSLDNGWLQPPVRVVIGILAGIGLLVVCELKAARKYPATANALDAAAGRS